MSTAKDQSDEEIPRVGTTGAMDADSPNVGFDTNGSERAVRKQSGGFAWLVLSFVLLSAVAWVGTRDSATSFVKQARVQRKMQEADAAARAEACELCSDANFTASVDEAFATFLSTFEYLREIVSSASDELAAEGAAKVALAREQDLVSLLESVGREDVEEFYVYYLIRHMYGSLGAQFYQDSYALLGETLEQCQVFGSFLNLTCPPMPDEIDRATAIQHMRNHADNTFSSICTSGAPLPFWSEPDGSGFLLVANEKSNQLHPVSGSGINMSAPIGSLNDFFLYVFWGNKVDPTSREWKDLVEANPLYSWFMSSLTPAKQGTVCGNGNLTGLNSGNLEFDTLSADMAANLSDPWCTPEDIPNENNQGTGGYTMQHFAKMWYGLLIENIAEDAAQVDVDSPWSTCCRSKLVDFGFVRA